MRSLDPTAQRAFQSGNPVVHGNRATFIWEGDSAPQLISDTTEWENRPRHFKRVSSALKTSSDETIWSCSLTLPRDAYIEYAFYNPISQEKFLDPLNARTVSNGMGSRNNFFYMPETMPSPFSMRRAEVRSGTHRYYFKLYALDTTLSLLPGATKEQVLTEMKGHLLAQGELMGTFSK